MDIVLYLLVAALATWLAYKLIRWLFRVLSSGAGYVGEHREDIAHGAVVGGKAVWSMTSFIGRGIAKLTRRGYSAYREKADRREQQELEFLRQNQRDTDTLVASLEDMTAKYQAAQSALEAEAQKSRRLASRLELESAAAEEIKARHDELARQLADEKARQHKAFTDLPFDTFVQTMQEKIAGVSDTEFRAVDQDRLRELAVAFDARFAAAGVELPSAFLEAPEHVRYVNSIEGVIDLYTRKIQKVKRDDGLDDDERDIKIEYWQRLMDKQVAELEG